MFDGRRATVNISSTELITAMGHGSSRTWFSREERGARRGHRCTLEPKLNGGQTCDNYLSNYVPYVCTLSLSRSEPCGSNTIFTIGSLRQSEHFVQHLPAFDGQTHKWYVREFEGQTHAVSDTYRNVDGQTHGMLCVIVRRTDTRDCHYWMLNVRRVDRHRESDTRNNVRRTDTQF